MGNLQSSSSQLQGAAMARHRCPQCRSNMVPASVIPGLGEFSHRIFECVQCDHVQIMPPTVD